MRTQAESAINTGKRAAKEPLVANVVLVERGSQE
jgi:hypothetical protein